MTHLPRFPGLAVLLAAAGLASCATLPGAAPARQTLPADTAVQVGRLENGLTYYIRRNSEPHGRAELRLVVNAGSVLEDADQRGLAHVVEHMAFNGTERFPKHALVDYLESVGMRFGPDINAYTSFDETVYQLTLPADTAGVVETGLRILRDWATGIRFDSLEVEKERAVVIEEWRLGQGAAARMRSRQFPVLTRHSRYAERAPIGTYASLTGFDHAALERFYRDWYRPDLMAVVVVGDVDPARMERLVVENFADIPAPHDAPRRREFQVPDHRNTLVSVVSDAEATGAAVSVYYKREPRQWLTEEAYRQWMVESVANSMLTNRLNEQTQRPHAPYMGVSSFHGRFIRPLSMYMLSARVPDDGILRGAEALLQEVRRAALHGFTSTEMEREKSEILRTMEQRYLERDRATSSTFAADYVSHFLYGGALVDIATEHALYQRFIPQITLDEVNEQARRLMGERNRVVLLSAPEKEGLRVPEEDEVRAMLERVEQTFLLAYTDSVSEAPLLAALPEPGSVVSERPLPEIGAVEWRLANGVRVLLKPTDFRQDEVLLAARSPGGTSLVPDEDYIAARTASAVVQVSGVGELNATELRKRLAGTVAGVGADIGDQYEGLSGAASPRDLETLFQLVYLKFVAPRVDTVAFLTYQEQAMEALQNRSVDPETVFGDTLRATLTGDHPRTRPISSEMFQELDMHRSFEIYRDRFADASDFTFYLVGSFSLDSIRPLVQRYLGALPSLGRAETGRDLGIAAPDGVVRRVVRRGVEPKARTQIVFHGDFPFSRENLFAINALAEVLNLRLREVLREDMGGTYGVQVRGAGWREPRPGYQFSVGFGAEPGRLPELVEATFAQIDSIRASGPSESDVRKVHEMQLRSRQLELRRNNFWVSQLMVYDRNGWDPQLILAYDEWLEALTPAVLQRSAQQLLRPDRYVQVSLLPEGAEWDGIASGLD